MSNEHIQRAIKLTERKLELKQKEAHAIESEEFAQAHRRAVQIELTQVIEELRALEEGRPIVHELVEE